VSAPATGAERRGLDPTGRFTSRATDYARHRPGYPPAAIDAVLEGLSPPPSLVAADVGAGTGISARALADRGVQVVAIEPNHGMREAAAPHPRVRWVAGTGERTGLPTASVDVVLVAQALHWLDLDVALAELLRVLRPGGRVAIWFNVRRRGDPLADGYERAIKAAAVVDPGTFALPPLVPLLASAGFQRVRRVDVDHEQVLDLAGLLGRVRSASYAPKEGPAWDRLEAELRSLHAAHADASGLLRVPHVTEVTLADAPP
jgi:SAM-dependent methyltransferase